MVLIRFLSIVLFRVFSESENYYCNQWEVNFLRTNHIPASGYQFLKFFRDFLRWKQLFHKVETYFSIFLSWLVQTDFLSCGNRFLLFNFFLQVETATEISGNPFFQGLYSRQKKGIFCLVKTVFFFYPVLLFCKSKLLLMKLQSWPKYMKQTLVLV